MFTSFETQILATRTEHNSNVCCDSCVEFFVQFDPANDKRYINFEINALGTVNNGIRLMRNDPSKQYILDAEMLDVKTDVSNDRWTVEYTIPISYIKKYVPTYEHKKGNIIRANFYKCGDETLTPHYGCFSLIKTDKPDFHHPEFFADFILD